jgi:nitrate/nitrite-specific signal transduction histidine kinase
MTDQLRTSLTGLEQRVAVRTDALHRQNEFLAALHETTLGLISHLDLNDLL